MLSTILVTPRVVRESASAAPMIPSVDPNTVVPQPFQQNSAWSEENGWHWVTMSYDGTQRFSGSNFDYSVGKPLPAATFVATRVRSLPPTDSCADCVMVGEETEGPPSILGGPSNPALKYAYEHLDNGPRHVIDSGNSGEKRWTRGSWYLNYSPISRTFFSWTWIPDDGGFAGVKTSAEISTAVLPSLAGLGAVNVAQVATTGSHVFPIVGQYQISQGYGCVPYNAGYASPSFCPVNLPSFHDGVDLASPAGTPIAAAAGGTVTFAGIDSSASGNSTIVIDLDGSNAGFETIYMHWEKTFVKKGDHVSAGQVIAEVGSVGYSTGPHLHFSVRVAATNQTIDPIAWLGGSVQLASTTTSAAPAYTNVMQWQPLIKQAADAHKVPAALIAAIMAVESSGNPNAVSPAGALGLMQVMPSELTRLGVPQSKWSDPASNIDAAARYLAETLDQGGSLQQAVARYFGSGCDALGTCTQDYVSRVLTLYVYFSTWIETGTAPAITSTVSATTPAAPVESTTSSAVPTPNTNASSTESTPVSTPVPATQPAAPTSTPAPSSTATQPTSTPAATSSPTAGSTPASTPTSQPTPAPSATSTPAPTSTQAPAATPSATATPSPTATQPPATATETTVPTQTGQQDPGSIPVVTPASTPAPESQTGNPVKKIIGPEQSEVFPGPSATPTATQNSDAAPAATSTAAPAESSPTP